MAAWGAGRVCRRLIVPASLLIVAVATPVRADAQAQTQIQYVYDAVGNVLQVTRSAAVPVPDLTVSNVSVGTITAVVGGAYSIPVTFRVSNVGTGDATGTWTDRGYLSANATLEDSDEILGGFNTRSTPLAAGASYDVSTTFTTAATTAPGSYTLIVKADGGAGTGQFAPTGANVVAESAEANNTQSIAIVLPAKTPDLAISNVVVGAYWISQAGAYSFPVTFTVTNLGGATAPASFYGLVYLSADATLDNADQNLAGFALRNTALAPGASYTVTQTYTTTAATPSGSYTLFAKIDGRGAAIGIGSNTDNGYVAEANEINNTQAVAVTLPAKPDLVISNVSSGAYWISQAGAYSFPVTFTVTNLGALDAQPYFYGLAYLSSDGTLDNADQNLAGFANRSTALAPGASYTATQTYTTTAATLSGTYTLFVKIDGRGSAVGIGTNTDAGYLAEPNEANNAKSLAVTLPAKPDLVITGASLNSIVRNANNSKSITVTFTVLNQGGLAAQPYWYDLAYLSSDGVLDNADANLSGYAQRSAALAPGASYTVTQTYTTSTTTAAGPYTLFLKADGRGTAIGTGTNTDNGRLAEENESNNTTSLGVMLP
ncbi:MAG: CARDB domain-containing protein [Burkholderiales bacterium]